MRADTYLAMPHLAYGVITWRVAGLLGRLLAFGDLINC
jgi:hypothetical protein